MQYKDSHNVDEQRDRFQHAIKMQIQIVSVAGEDEHGYRTELAQLIEEADLLARN